MARIVNGGTVSVIGPSTFDTHVPAVLATKLSYTPWQSPVIVTVPVLGITFVDIMNNPTYFTTNNITLPPTMTSGFYVIGVQTNASFDGHVQMGDIVTQIGDVTILNSLDFKAGFSKYRVGDIIDIIVYRNGAYMTIEDIELKPRP